MKKSTRKIIVFCLLAGLILALILFLYLVDPEAFVRQLGIQNAYLLTLLMAFSAGFSSVTAYSTLAMVITLVSGGVNPLYLGLIAGIGLAASDLIMFGLTSKGRELVTGKWDARFKKVAGFFKGKRAKALPFLAYFYLITPLPNDLLIVFFALIQYPLKKLALPVIAGDLTHYLLITFLTAKGVMLFR